jgi:hypothetical protein
MLPPESFFGALATVQRRQRPAVLRVVSTL